MQFLFVEEKIIDERFYNELLLTKELRVDTQYYLTEENDLKKLKNYSKTAESFVLKMEEIIEKITTEQIKVIRKALDSIMY